MKCCIYGKQECEVNLFTRKCCPRCRLEKCFSIGMRLNSGSESGKKLGGSSSSDLSSPSSIIAESPQYVTVTSNKLRLVDEILEQDFIGPELSSQQLSPESNSIKEKLEPALVDETKISGSPDGDLTVYELDQIRHLQDLISRFFVDESRLPVVKESSSVVFTFNTISHYGALVVRLCRRLAPFQRLTKQDQLEMLKHAFFAVMVTRISFAWDPVRAGFPLIEVLFVWKIIQLSKLSFFQQNAEATKAIYVYSSWFNCSPNRDATGLVCKLTNELHQVLDHDVTIRDLVSDLNPQLSLSH